MRLGVNLGYWGAGMAGDNLAVAQEADRLGYTGWAAEGCSWVGTYPRWMLVAGRTGLSGCMSGLLTGSRGMSRG